MRVEPHAPGSIVHVMQRGTRGIPIVRNRDDKWRFVQSLFYLNDEQLHQNWRRDIAALTPFDWPVEWPEQKPLVEILAWTLLSNHFHLLLIERAERGLAAFMQRLCGSMAASFNRKYGERGSLFQGSYRSRTVRNDAYFQQLLWYILVKNTLEMRPGGIAAAVRHFDDAWKWAEEYPFSSFGATMRGEPEPPLIDSQNIIVELCRGDSFKDGAKELLQMRAFGADELQALALEDW